MEEHQRQEILSLVAQACKARGVSEFRLASIFGHGTIIKTIRSGPFGPHPKTLAKFEAFLREQIKQGDGGTSNAA